MNIEVDLLNKVHEAALLGEDVTMTLLKKIMNKENTITDEVKTINEHYKNYVRISEKALIGLEPKPKKPGLGASLMAKQETITEVNKDNSDARIAKMLIKSMSIEEMEMAKFIEAFNDKVSAEALKIAKDFKGFHSKMIVKLEEYL